MSHAIGLRHTAHIHREDRRSGIAVKPTWSGELWEGERFVVTTDSMESEADVLEALTTLVQEREAE